MSGWDRGRLDWFVTEERHTVEPWTIGSDTAFYYSIPVFDELGDGEVEQVEDIGSGKLLLRGGEVLVSKLNPRIPRVIQAEAHDIPTIASTEFIALRPSPAVDARYLSYWLGSEVLRQFLNGATMSVTRSQQRVRPEVLTKSWVQLPSRPQQQRIVSILDAETVHIDVLLANKRRLVALLVERFEAAVFAAVTQGLRGERLRRSGLAWVHEIPEGWGTPTVSVNFDLLLGKMLNAEAAGGPDQYRYVRNTNVQWDHFELDDLATMHFGPDDRVRCALRAGDLLVCEGGEVGRAAVRPGEPVDCYFQKAIHRVRPRSGANARFLMYCLRAAAKQNVFAVEGNLSTIAHLTGDQLAAHRFPWPPSPEQGEIVRHLDALAETVAATRNAVERQMNLLRERRQALITAAVTGELEIPGLAA